MKSALVDRRLREAARKLKCTSEEIWEELAAGFVDSIPTENEVIVDIEEYVQSKRSDHSL